MDRAAELAFSEDVVDQAVLLDSAEPGEVRRYDTCAEMDPSAVWTSACAPGMAASMRSSSSRAVGIPGQGSPSLYFVKR